MSANSKVYTCLSACSLFTLAAVCLCFGVSGGRFRDGKVTREKGGGQAPDYRVDPVGVKAGIDCLK